MVDFSMSLVGVRAVKCEDQSEAHHDGLMCLVKLVIDSTKTLAQPRHILLDVGRADAEVVHLAKGEQHHGVEL